MFQLSVSQIHFKSLVQTQLMQLSFQCADKREPLRVTTNQKVIKYAPPWTQQFDMSKFLLIYVEIEDELTGLIKVIGFSKFELSEIIGKEGIYKIDLEYGNQASVILKCVNPQEMLHNSAQMQSQISWTQSLRAEPGRQKRYGSPQAIKCKTQQNFRNVNIQHLQHVQNVQLPTQSMTNLSEGRYSAQKGRESYNSNFTYTAYEVTNKCSQYQQTDGGDSSQFKQMMKELSLLLEVPQECDAIVYAVQHLLQQFRQQYEQLLKIQCENQIINSLYKTLEQQKNVIELKSEDFRTSIKQKLKTYKTLFEENVQLKNTLKEDLHKIVELNLKIKELQKNETQPLDTNIITQKIKQVTENIQKSKEDFAILMEEINLISQ